MESKVYDQSKQTWAMNARSAQWREDWRFHLYCPSFLQNDAFTSDAQLHDAYSKLEMQAPQLENKMAVGRSLSLPYLTA